MNLQELNETYDSLVTQINTVMDLQSNDKESNPLFQSVNFQLVNKLFDIYLKISPHDYSKKNENIQRLKSNYLNSADVSNENKVQAVLKWALKYDSKANIKISKDILNNHISTNTKDHITIYNFIMNGKLDYTIADIKKMPYDFLEFIFTQFEFNKTKTSKKSSDDSDSDSDNEEGLKNFEVKEKEIFCINLLCGLNLTEKQIHSVLKFLTISVNPKLMYWPSGRVKKFEGNLLPKIIQYYKTNPPNFLVNHRRNVGIILENQTTQFYNLESYLESDNGKIYANNFTIEFPYMCYVYINSIDFTYNQNKFECKPFSAKAHLGSEIMVHRFKNLINNQKNEDTEDMLPYTIIMSENLETTKPCPYVSISFPGYIYKSISNLKIYGQAICLV